MAKSRDEIHAANRRRWEVAATDWARKADSRGLWRRCAKKPGLVLSAQELGHLGKVRGKRVCVLGSGDNQAVFALAGLGAAVTSVDIAENQLKIAKRRARQLGLTIRFVRADVTDLSAFRDGSFDIVYTGGHVAVWVADLAAFHREAVRILVPSGLLMISEYHPFRRIWRESRTALSVQSPYLNRGPFRQDYSEDVLAREPGSFTCYEFHWTVADHLNAVIRAGCRLVAVEEYGEQVGDWEGAPLDGLPEDLLIAARKATESRRPGN